MRYCYADTETFCAVPIKNGTHAYAEKAEVMLFAYAFDDGPIFVWDVTSGGDMPSDLAEAINDPECIFIFHNAAFDVTVLRWALKISLPFERVRCTMAKAYAHGLPGSLGTLCEIFQLPVDKAKDKEGKKLIQLFCMPRKTGPIERATTRTHPLEWARFVEYARLDIAAMRELDKKIPSWNYQGDELALWHLDQKINTRGFKVDIELCQAAIKAVDRAQKALADRTGELSLGDLASTTQRDETLRHILQYYGVELPDLQASTLERRMDDPDLPVALKELLGIRLQASTTSTAKYKKVMACASKDGRLRGTLQWCGAARTGRDSGRLFQPQNLACPSLKPEVIEFGIEALKVDCADLYFDNMMELTSNAARGCITAPQGKKLVVADLSNIEGRYAAWLAREDWKLKAFEDFDTIIGRDDNGEPIRKGPDLYKLAYAKSFKVSAETVTKQQRNDIGKPLELSMQFGGGCGAFATFAMNAGVNLEKLVHDAWDIIPVDVLEEATRYWKYCEANGRTMGFTERVFITCDSLKRLWRRAHPAIVSFWKMLEDTARNAIDSKGTSFYAGALELRRDGNWLRIIQPGGRSLSYPSPRLDAEGGISFMGVDQYSRKWSRIKTMGPKIFENGVQGGARNVFMSGVIEANDSDYATVLRIHDEQVCETPDTSEFTSQGLCQLMTRKKPWMKGLPLAAEGFETYRYRKG